jgi:glycosyltransferase involved in cell wall biosynthesis
MASPLVSVITPTWARHDALMDRCVASVAAQTYRPIEHIIVSDGPDEYLRNCEFPSHVQYHELPEHTPANGRWGTKARLHGIDLAEGEFICYLDDDDRYRARHVEALAGLLAADPAMGFAYSYGNWMDPAGRQEVGYFANTTWPSFAQIGTGVIMNRRETLDVATWRDNGVQDTIDWDLIDRWLAAGVPWGHAMDPDASVEFILRPDSSINGWRP